MSHQQDTGDTLEGPDLQTYDEHSFLGSALFSATDSTNDITVTFRWHGLPLRVAQIPVSQLLYVANELDSVVGGPNTVVVLGVWADFTTFPLEVYYQRLVTIRRAVQRLLNRGPGTKVIIRTANMRQQNLPSSLISSDWYALQRDKVLRAVFKDTGAVLLEAWDMVQAHDHLHDLHPPPEIIKLMIDQVLSHTCPGTRR
ncbi:hypothetical protein WMY93_004078 [Mugilogobius chulae]|uniref:NXPE C-terminal domain-containing protein n=1 Tax=Mugilogobius chulae TaxID=88201 RepID=A0AAW0PMT3_9GOBI